MQNMNWVGRREDVSEQMLARLEKEIQRIAETSPKGIMHHRINQAAEACVEDLAEGLGLLEGEHKESDQKLFDATRKKIIALKNYSIRHLGELPQEPMAPAAKVVKGESLATGELNSQLENSSPTSSSVESPTTGSSLSSKSESSEDSRSSSSSPASSDSGSPKIASSPSSSSESLSSGFSDEGVGSPTNTPSPTPPSSPSSAAASLPLSSTPSFSSSDPLFRPIGLTLPHSLNPDLNPSLGISNYSPNSALPEGDISESNRHPRTGPNRVALTGEDTDSVVVHFKKGKEDRSLDALDHEIVKRLPASRMTTAIMTNHTSQRLFQKKIEQMRFQEHHPHPQHGVSRAPKQVNVEPSSPHKGRILDKLSQELCPHLRLPQKHHEGLQRMENREEQVHEHAREGLDVFNPSPAGSSAYGEVAGGNIDGTFAVGKLIWTAYHHNKKHKEDAALTAEVKDLKSKTLALREQMAKQYTHVSRSLADMTSTFSHDDAASEKQKGEITQFFAACEPIIKILGKGTINADDLKEISKFAEYLSSVSESSESVDVIRIVGEIATCIGMIIDYQLQMDVLKIKESLLSGNLVGFHKYLKEYVGELSSLVGGIGIAVHALKYEGEEAAMSVGGVASKAVGVFGLGLASILSMYKAGNAFARDLEKLYAYEQQIKEIQTEMDNLEKTKDGQMSEGARKILLKTLKARQDNIKRAYETYAAIAGLKDFLVYAGSGLNCSAAVVSTLVSLKILAAGGAVAGTIGTAGLLGIILISVGGAIGLGFAYKKHREACKFKPVKEQSEKVQKAHMRFEKTLNFSLNGYSETPDGIDEVQVRLHQRILCKQLKTIAVEESRLSYVKFDYYQKKFEARTPEAAGILDAIHKLELTNDKKALMEIIQRFEPGYHPEHGIPTDELASKARSLISRYVLGPVHALKAEDLDESIAQKQEALAQIQASKKTDQAQD